MLTYMVEDLEICKLALPWVCMGVEQISIIWIQKILDSISLYQFLPAIPTQKKIAAIVSAYDDLIENNDRRITLLEKMAEEIYREWFVRLRFPGHRCEPHFIKASLEGWEDTVIKSK